VATADGKVYQGLIIYEAVGSLLLQTGPTQTERIVDRQITDRRSTQTSLMPVGLLDKISDRDIADLYAYLKSWQGPTAAR
jgi:putative heme-binding domain-containing protein